MRKWKLAFIVGVLAVVLAAIKLAIGFYSLEFISVSPLLLSVVGGIIFILGFVLSCTISDFRDSEKIPVEIVNSLESIYEDGLCAKKQKKKFDISRLKKNIARIIDDFEHDMENGAKKAMDSTASISESIIEMDNLGISASYGSRIKSEQSNVRKHIMRAYQIKETSFIPAAYAILEILVGGIVVLMLFATIGSFYESILLTGIVSFFLIYMVLLIKDIDDPFEKDGIADVDLFLLDELKEKLKG